MWTKDQMPDLTGKIIIVTGANTGIGFETAKALYEKGAHVVLACRDLSKAENAKTGIEQNGGTGLLSTEVLDLSSLNEVKQFADRFITKYNQLDVLINNAGVMIPPVSKTQDDFELQFGVNFIGHFALTAYLFPLLKATPESRVVTLSSMAYLHGVINFDNFQSQQSYEPMREYAQSKLANLIFSIEMQRRLSEGKYNMLSIAAQPGANKTDLSRYMTEDEYSAAVNRIGALMDPWQGALPSLYAATTEKAEGGVLYGPDGKGGYTGYPAKAIINPVALDLSLNKKLWSFAEKVIGISFL